MSFKCSLRLTLLFSFTTFSSFGQELFPLNEPASSVPKSALGVRVISQSYSEGYLTRTLQAMRLMYGLTSKLSVMVTVSASNHHGRNLPPDFMNHSHSGNSTNYYASNIKYGVKYPYLFNGFDFFAKYRIISLDRKNQHFRVAGYAEFSTVKAPHHEAEPNLMDDTGGYGYGGIATFLKDRFAASITCGIIKPNPYFDPNPHFTLGQDVPTKVYYGDAIRYNLSFGYRFYPNHYKDYDQPNWNIYVEFMGKRYDAARIIQDGAEIPTKTLVLRSGSYVEVHPGIQRIIKSNLRMEFSYGLPFIGNSYVHTTPLWTFALQQYFYRK